MESRQKSLLTQIEGLLDYLPTLHQILDEQHELVVGQVEPEQSRQRLAIANHIGMTCQRLELELARSGEHPSWREEVRGTRALAESVLRENPTLQAQGPLHVVKFDDIPERYVLNWNVERELRKGFGLHRKPKNDEGPSVVIAFTAPEYRQMWHAHTVDEYTLVTDTPFLASYYDGEIQEMHAGTGELFHFFPHTYHTLVNLGSQTGRTLTVKYPVGISVWLPAYDLTGVAPGSARVCRLVDECVDGGARLQRFRVKDQHHDYAIDLISLGPGTKMTFASDTDKFLLVLDGRVVASSQGVTVLASANDLLVAEPTGNLALQAHEEGARLYLVKTT